MTENELKRMAKAFIVALVAMLVLGAVVSARAQQFSPNGWPIDTDELYPMIYAEVPMDAMTAEPLVPPGPWVFCEDRVCLAPMMCNRLDESCRLSPPGE